MHVIGTKDGPIRQEEMMAAYVGRRIVNGILTVLVLVTVTFFLTRIMPGSPFQGNHISKETMEMMEEEYGLNEPVSVQYVSYVSGLVRGDFGRSYKKPSMTVTEIIGQAFPYTWSLGILAFSLALIVGILEGMLLAWTGRSGLQQGVLAVSVCGICIPNFLIAVFLQLVFGVWLKILPTSGVYGLSSYILPVVALAAYPSAVIARLSGNAISRILKKDYIQAARMRGIPARRIYGVHVLKNAVLPLLGYLGPMFAYLVTGSFVVESIFGIPGLGREFVNSIANRDYTLIMGLTIFMGVVVIAANLLMDLIRMLLDPGTREKAVQL